MLIGQQVVQVLAVVVDARHHPVIAVEYQNHAAAAPNLEAAHSAKRFY
jgi:hypothetical protein